jgi:hypothetical protein
MKLNQAREELIQEPDYRRMTEAAITYYSRVYLAFKIVYGPKATVQDWMKYQADEEMRQQYEALKELIQWEDNNA